MLTTEVKNGWTKKLLALPFMSEEVFEQEKDPQIIDFSSKGAVRQAISIHLKDKYPDIKFKTKIGEDKGMKVLKLWKTKEQTA